MPYTPLVVMMKSVDERSGKELYDHGCDGSDDNIQYSKDNTNNLFIRLQAQFYITVMRTNLY